MKPISIYSEDPQSDLRPLILVAVRPYVVFLCFSPMHAHCNRWLSLCYLPLSPSLLSLPFRFVCGHRLVSVHNAKSLRRHTRVDGLLGDGPQDT